jgi:hypothetical protein
MRTRRIIRRNTAADRLDLNDELAVVGLCCGFWRVPEHCTRAWWGAVKWKHGERIELKMAVAMPGCRPGWRYALGELPPPPIVEPIPQDHLDNREFIDIEGTIVWHPYGTWARCQAEHLRELGECDGAEWQRYLAWKRTGYEARYVFDDDPQGSPCNCVRHGCY